MFSLSLLRQKKLYAFFLLVVFVPLFLSAQKIEGRFRLAPGKKAPAAASLDQVKYVEIFSITCPHCYNFFQKSAPFFQAYQGKINRTAIEVGWLGDNVTRFFYLAEKEGKGSQAEGLLFRAFHESGVRDLNNPDKLKIFAQELKLGDDFQKKMMAPEISQRVATGQKFVNSFGLKSTPSFVLEDSVIVEGDDVANLSLVINSMLKKPVTFKP